MSATTSALDLPNWLAQQKAKNAADGIGDNLLTPPPAANRPIGAERLNDTYVGPPSPSFSPVIGAYGAHPVTAAMRANALDIASAASQFGPADVASIRAFHGSPYDFNAFDTSKIGTGEGNQAFGYGHYAAEAEGTAQAYKRPSASLEWNGQPVEPGKPAYDLVDNLSNQDWRLGKIVEQATKYGPANAVETFEPHTRNASDGAAWRAAMDKFQVGAGKSATGHMYELAIHADPEHFLDWDKPLSEQHDKVVSAVADLAAKKGIPMGNATGARAYGDLSNPPYGTRGHGVNDPAALSEALRDAGIPGIKYLDQGSRAQGQGTSNYVIFDPKTIEILRKYGIAGLMAGGAAAATQSSNSNQ